MALARASAAAGVAARLLQAWREDPGKVTLALGIATSAAVASGWAKAVDGRPPASKLELGGALVGGIATTVASFWLAENGRRRWRYSVLVVGVVSFSFAIGLREFDTKVFMDICKGIL